MKSVRPLLGTYVVVEVNADDDDTTRAAIDAAFAAITQVQRLMSAFDSDSDVSRINARAHLEAVHVHAWTADVLRLAITLHAESAGLFDIGIAPHLAQWDMLPMSDIDDRDSSATKLVIDGQSVRSSVPTRIDLGGIAKGFAVDRAIDAAIDAGARGVLVNAGGDLRVAGDLEAPVYLRNPHDPQQVALAGTLRDGAMATSAIYYSKRQHEGAMVSAIVEPVSGQPLLDESSHSVIAPSCAVADALTKVLALSGNPNHTAFARHQAQALIVPAA